MLATRPFSLLETLNAIDDALDHNADLADDIFQLGLASFGLNDKPLKGSEMDWRGKAKPNDISKAHSTIRQFYRDWTHEGFKLEVEPLLNTVLSDLQSFLSPTQPDTPCPSLLLPGAGLGRLLFELCLRGYHTTGNEISYHQLLGSNFILNSTQYADQYPIYPFANTFTNVTSRTNQLQRHTVPDLHPAHALNSRLESGHPVGEMNMTAGDFVLSYSTPESQSTFDGVVSVFFIDTAPNLIRYIETVRNCLRDGGIWTNIGPLLWHFDDRVQGRDDDDDAEEKQEAGEQHSHQRELMEDKGIAEPGSFELTDEEVLALVSRMGFEVVKHEILGSASLASNARTTDTPSSAPNPGSTDRDTQADAEASAFHQGGGIGYMQDPTSLLQNRYRCSHWVARKMSSPSS